ncbi:hypothetical protein [Sandaracinus amylolyticus]|uniref:Multiple EGF-like-domain protein 3 n=1 Tax=Sandaracinus amylolyticus TaxID=927083 RepID=A0A0F6W9Q6_9BACT|nr:hypothetical protein [Sandaracinus amylolyticus]AKF11037.1 Multiple EGF-like-domain protein 3 precursor [Sandaracinus amylolyticus]
MRRLWIVVLALCAAGCSVERPDDLLTRLWTCEVQEDCLDGWRCADRSVLGEDFCRPACDPADASSCDGYCTRNGECLSRCTLLGDGATECPDGHSCVRTDLLSGEGVCYPVETCSRSDECAQGTLCFNDVFDLPPVLPGVSYASDQLYCVAVPDEMMRCPTGYLVAPAAGDSPATCLPRCDSAGSRCPPGLTCLRELGYLFAQPGASACYPGSWGVPCDDDAQCLLGRCLAIGEGRRACTYGCGEADRVFEGDGCEALEEASRGLRLDALEVRCLEAEGRDVCAPLGTTGAPCNDDMRCAEGLECRRFLAGGSIVRFCSRDCASDAECNDARAPLTAYCEPSAGGGSCLPRSFEGGGCERAEQCRLGLICRENVCVAP